MEMKINDQNQTNSQYKQGFIVVSF